MISWIRSFLIGRTQQVLVDSIKSSSRPVASGVPQGTVLGPLLFLIYINDISNGLSPGTKIRLFADDSLLYRTINSKNDCDILQHDLNKLQQWEKSWKMEFHPQKCQLLTITNKINPTKNIYSIHNIPLQKTDSAKYLGVLIDSKLRWKSQIHAVSKKANYVLSFLRRNIGGCPENVKNKCFNTLVRPILEYGCSVWDPHHQTDIDYIEKINKRAARFVTGNYVFENGNTKINMHHLNWKPLEERRAVIKLNLLYKARNNMIDIPTSHLVINQSSTRRKNNYAIPTSNVDSHLYSFYPNTIRLWNSLPVECMQQSSAESFKKAVDQIIIKSAY